MSEEYNRIGQDTPLVSAGFIHQAVGDTFRNEMETKVQVHAIPYRGGDGFPAFYLDIEPGEHLIWKHIVKQSIGIFGDGLSEPVEYLMFGRINRAGHQFVIVVDWEGHYAKFESEAEAYKAIS